MSKGLRSFPENKRLMVAERRVRSDIKGNGFWGATDFLNTRKATQLKKKDLKDLTKQDIKDAVYLHDEGKL